jgi:riboflavin kinase/FMN adenylyltransferase
MTYGKAKRKSGSNSIFAAMQLHRSAHLLPAFRNAVITIGTFDGVHSGHRQLLAAMQEEARKVNGETVLVTFDPHPRAVVQPHLSLQLINTLEERIELLRETGLDHLVIVPFTTSFAELSAEEYIREFLVNTFHPHTVIIGYDHRFGKGRNGDFSLLEANAPLYNYALKEIPRHMLDEIAVSSTKIRKALQSGDIDVANRLLGYPFFFEGLVIRGDQLGRQLGFPTANLKIDGTAKILPAQGVYAVTASLENRHLKGMLSIGSRPTLNGADERIEVNLFDFDEEIYGQRLRVAVQHYLRRQVRYDSLDELKAQLQADKTKSLTLL